MVVLVVLIKVITLFLLLDALNFILQLIEQLLNLLLVCRILWIIINIEIPIISFITASTAHILIEAHGISYHLKSLIICVIGIISFTHFIFHS